MINNLPLQFQGKTLDYLGTEAHRTRVVLTNEDGTYYPVFFEPSYIDKPDSELLELALEVVYQKNFYKLAEEQKFAKYEQLLKELEQAIERCNQQTAESELKMNKGIAEMLALITTISPLSGLGDLDLEESEEDSEESGDGAEEGSTEAEGGESNVQPSELEEGSDAHESTTE